MKEIVFLNGEFILEEEVSLPVLTPGFLYGWGLFETMRAYDNKIVYFDEHLGRVKESAKLLDIKLPYAIASLKGIIQETVKANGFKDTCARLTLWKSRNGADILVTAKEYKPYPARKYKKGFFASVSSCRQNENSLFAQLKTTNYLLCRLAYNQAIEKGFDEAIILNHKGYVAEASRSNLFFIRGKELFTPSLKCGCLDGITRRAVFDLAQKYKIKAFEGNFTIPDLFNSDEAFLTSSLMGIMPLVSVDGHCVGRGTGQGKLSKFFIEKYKSLFKK